MLVAISVGALVVDGRAVWLHGTVCRCACLQSGPCCENGRAVLLCRSDGLRWGCRPPYMELGCRGVLLACLTRRSLLCIRLCATGPDSRESGLYVVSSPLILLDCSHSHAEADVAKRINIIIPWYYGIIRFLPERVAMRAPRLQAY